MCERERGGQTPPSPRAERSGQPSAAPREGGARVPRPLLLPLSLIGLYDTQGLPADPAFEEDSTVFMVSY